MNGLFEACYLAFLETIAHLRPKLHRYCSRMTGSVLDDEDVVQDALFQAYRKLDTFDDARPLAPWLFRIAHTRCIDFLRRREVRQEAEAEAVQDDSIAPIDPVGPALGRAVEYLVMALPPKERACPIDQSRHARRAVTSPGSYISTSIDSINMTGMDFVN
jgi:RNA polymerase sigma-70 factor (ECF subfamily)